MKGEIISIGTELLLGDIVNTNAQYLSKKMASLGIDVYFQAVVGDNEERVLNTFKSSFKRSDIVITTGGLGPTADDLSKEVGAKLFNKKLVLDQTQKDKLDDFFKSLNKKMTDNNLKQAYVPEGCTVLYNDNGTAPGVLIDENDKILIMLPGPPREMVPMFEKSVIPYLMKKQKYMLFSKSVRIAGIGESYLETLLKDLMENQTNPTIALYAKSTEVVLRITAKASDQDDAETIIKPVYDEIKNIVGDAIYGEDETLLNEVVADMLKERNMKIAVCESCTGGLLADEFVKISGISDIFMEGIVTYSNEAKVRLLGVKEETLEKFGAVSEEVANEMATFLYENSGCNVTISTTGIAGPDGGTDEKPVGLVYIGVCINGKTTVKKFNLAGTRAHIREYTVYYSLNMLRLLLKENPHNCLT